MSLQADSERTHQLVSLVDREHKRSLIQTQKEGDGPGRAQAFKDSVTDKALQENTTGVNTKT